MVCRRDPGDSDPGAALPSMAAAETFAAPSTRRVATRYGKHVSNHIAMLKLARVKIWMRVYESVAEMALEFGGLRPCMVVEFSGAFTHAPAQSVRIKRFPGHATGANWGEPAKIQPLSQMCIDHVDVHISFRCQINEMPRNLGRAASLDIRAGVDHNK